MTRPAALIDRDGTIIVERNYLGDPANVALERGAAAGLRAIAALGLPIMVVTNQSGIARGYFDRAAVDQVNARMLALLAHEGVAVAGIYVCPHGADDGCYCRKPSPGLALAATAEHDLDLAASFVIGDKRADLELAAAIGATGLLVRTGHGTAVDVRPDEVVVDDLAAAAAWIIGRYGGQTFVSNRKIFPER